MAVEHREGWRRTWVIALREIRERAGSRAFRLSTVAGVAMVVALVLVPSVLGGTKAYRVGLAGRTPAGTASALVTQADAAGRDLNVRQYPTVADGERAVRDGAIDALLVDAARLEWRREKDGPLTAVVVNAVGTVRLRERAARLGVAPDRLADLLAPIPMTSRTLETGGADDEDARTVAFIAVGLMYVAVSVYAGFVLTGVVQEKASRVAEVLLARMPAHEILTGKVLGIGAVGLAQLAVIGAAAGVTAAVRGGTDTPHIPVGMLAWTCAWFLLGYVLYAVLYAALGATTSRTEDAQSAIAPVTGLLLLSYLGVLYAEERPDAALTLVLSYFPPTAPVVMTYRTAVHAVPAWQSVTSAVVMVLFTWALIRVAGRIYSAALLRFGRRVPVRELLRVRSN